MLSRRRLVAIAGASLIVIALLNWLIFPFLFPPVYHALDVMLEEKNVIEILFSPHVEDIKGLVPNKLIGIYYYWWPRWVRMRAGWGRLSVGAESYEYAFVYFEAPIYQVTVGVGPKARYMYYLIDFFSNSSELGELFQAYGLPHSHVKALYRHFSDGSVNRTRLSMTYPDGRSLIELSAITPKAGEISQEDFGARNLYHLDGKNLTIFHISQINAFSMGGSSIDSHANITFAENSTPWRYVGRTSLVTGKDVHSFPLTLIEGKIGWIKWG